MTTVSNRVIARDDFGRFMANLEDAARATVSETLDVGINASRAAAPIKSGRLKRSFYKTMLSGHSGVYSNLAPYAKFQDEGVGRHEKSGWVAFAWDGNPRGYWLPGTNMIDHPGNPATEFMAFGWHALSGAANGIMHKNYG